VAVEWLVSYTIDPPSPIDPAEPTVPALNLELHYGPGGLLHRATHTVATDNADDPDAAWETSRLDLLIFWEVLQYQSGAKIRVRRMFATAEGHQVRQMYHAMRPEPPVMASLPDAGRFAAAPPGLATWLWLANAAEHEADDANALRNYYVILEGIHGKRPGGTLYV
jgi:hypothetical protein